LDAKSGALKVPHAGGPPAALRSALVPGAGQRYVGRSGRGNLLLTSVMGLGAFTLVAHESYLGARRDQTDAQRRFIAATTEEDLNHWRAKLEDAANDADSKNTLQWAFVGLTAGAYIWNVVDAWFIGGRTGSEAPLDMSVVPRLDGVEASLTWRMH
jgi:TM2 domain-containing membrane protein YozV